MKAPKSAKTLLLQKAWITAYKSPTPLHFKFATQAGAIRARMALYNAVKAEKHGVGDLELVDAAQNVEVCWVPDSGKKEFWMRRVEESDFIKGIEAALGEGIGSQVDPEIADMERRMLEKMQAPKPPAEKSGGLAPLSGNYGGFERLLRKPE